ncbi:MAG TPA: AraC family transcriptional regulator [Burkholderiales bacterium]|nr:AraC family transcriptional regulator [Burkholderiales bacterium]
MDALSDVLKTVRLDGAVYLNAEFTAPWCARTRFGLMTAAGLPGADGPAVFFHYMLEGRCKVRLDAGGETLEAGPGDLILLPHDDTHILGSDLQLAPLDSTNLVALPPPGEMFELRHGGGGEPTRFVCGYLMCDRRTSRPLFQSLPKLLRISVGDGPGAAWIADMVRMGVRETASAHPGGATMLARMSELLFVESMRRYAATLPEGRSGWLAGLSDPHVGRALALLHADPARAWTVDDLAREVALSRSSLGERFGELIGEPPMQYLTRWRLGLAAQALRAGAEPIARIAGRIGYESEAAFNRAFKREFGAPPAKWRRNPA